MARRHVVVWQRRAYPAEIEVASGSDRGTRLESRFGAAPSLGQFFRRQQAPIAVGIAQAAFGQLVERQAVAQRGEHVVHLSSTGVEVARILRHQPRHTVLLCQVDQGAGQRRLAAAGVVIVHLDGEMFAEGVAPLMQQSPGVVGAAGSEQGRQPARHRSGEQLQSVGTRRHVGPGEPRPAARGAGLVGVAERAGA